MASLAWGNFSNGRIPTSSLREVDNGQYLQAGAAGAWMEMRKACHDATGYWIGTEEGYRSLATQQSYADQKAAGTAFVGVSVATPGSSNHGWGRANDVKGYNQPGVWAWLQAHAGAFGWDNTTGRNVGENWHWEYVGDLNYTPIAILVIEEEKEEPMYRVVNLVNEGIWLVGPTGRRTHLTAINHVTLLDRFLNAKTGDKRETFYGAEIDIINQLLSAVQPETPKK